MFVPGKAAERAARELDGRLEGVLRLHPAPPAGGRIRPIGDEGRDRPADRRRLADEVAREVDQVAPEVQERVRAGDFGILVPRERGLGIQERGVREAGTEVVDPPEPALVDQATRERHRR